MIVFFKSIRKKLLSENKFSKYTLYAIGEIVLVTIGILMALMVNNCNQNRIKVKEEQKLLSQIYSDLSATKSEIIELSKRLEINKNGIDSLLLQLDRKVYTSLVPVYTAFTTRKSYFNNASSGFIMTQNGMASIISNEKILKSTLNLYEIDFPNILKREDIMHEKIDDLQNQFINKYFTKAPNNFNIKLNDFDLVVTDLFEPLNFDKLSQNIEFKNNILQLRKSVEIRLAFNEKTLTKVNSALELLEDEITSE